MSGHSKWSTIKRKKAANDARRGSMFTHLAREIAIAAREGGGDLEANFNLRLAVDRARANNMPKENIERAVRRGTGEDKEGAAFEQVSYEAYAPHGVALVIDAVTDNRNRTVAELRHVLTRAGGTMADAGSVAWQFHRKAYFVLSPTGVNPDAVFDAAVDAGAEDVVVGEEAIEVVAPVESFRAISERLSGLGIELEDAGLRRVPGSMISLPTEEALQVMRLIESLEELDEVQQVYSTLDVTEDAVAMLETA
jgi:YebC/PmpR family DNA-binding regulatory protein